MTPTIPVRPAAGLMVRDPVTGVPLPATGATVPRDPYWLRRLRTGDVVEVAPPDAVAIPPGPAPVGEG